MRRRSGAARARGVPFCPPVVPSPGSPPLGPLPLQPVHVHGCRDVSDPSATGCRAHCRRRRGPPRQDGVAWRGSRTISVTQRLQRSFPQHWKVDQFHPQVMSDQLVRVPAVHRHPVPFGRQSGADLFHGRLEPALLRRNPARPYHRYVHVYRLSELVETLSHRAVTVHRPSVRCERMNCAVRGQL